MSSHEPGFELSEEELLARAAAEEPKDQSAPRVCTPLERRFIDYYLGPAKGQASVAAKMVGWTPNNGAVILERPWVQEEIARQVELIKSRVGSIELDKERLLLELDNALLEAKAAYSEEISGYGTCPDCGKRVAVTMRAGPKEKASLTVAISRAVDIAARIVGALAPTKVQHEGKTDEQGTYHTLVRMVRENPGALSPTQRELMIENARKDQADIAELLTLLEIPEEVAH